MSRKTIKGLEEKIAELEKELLNYIDIIKCRNKQIERMENVANDSFENSTEYRRMNNEIDFLKTLIESYKITIKNKEATIKANNKSIKILKDKNEALQEELENLKVNSVHKIKNERGAGRKERFTEEEKATLKMLRFQGKSYRAIAKELNCSVATVHKIINEQK